MVMSLRPLSVLIPGGVYCCVVTTPSVLSAPVLNRLAPSSRDADRSTLAKRTFSSICDSTGGTTTLSRLTTLPNVPAIAAARLAAMESGTVPRRNTLSPSVVRATSYSGSSARSCSRTRSTRAVLCRTIRS